MVPKIHAKGKSFRGAASYLLHDVGADTAQRVAWTDVRNVATRNAEAVWRVMAATAMDQDRLKQQAGIPNTGRKSKDHVLHFSLSWHAEEAPTLSRQEMMRAAITILSVMKAEEHQALIICHTDTPQPHVHVLVNRVHPRDGRILSSSFEKLKASRWAQKYEEERGKIYCAERVVNNAARDRKEFTRGDKGLPRHIYEVMRVLYTHTQKRRLLEDHRRWARMLKDQQRRLHARRDAATTQLESAYKARLQVIAQSTNRVALKQVSALRAGYRPLWKELFDRQRNELASFGERETSKLGRVQNALRSVDFGALLGKRMPGDGRAGTISGVFQVLSDSGQRLEILKRNHQAEKLSLTERQRREEASIIGRFTVQRTFDRKAAREQFLLGRNDLLFEIGMETAKLKAAWHEKSRQLRRKLESLLALEARIRTQGPRPQLAAEASQINPAAAQILYERVQSVREAVAQGLKNTRRASRRR